MMTTHLDNLNLVKTALDKLNSLCINYSECHETYTATIQDETKRQEEDVKYSDRMVYVTKYKKQIDEWIQSTEQHLSDHLDRQSCYKSTAGSSCSRCSNKALEAKAALAELLVEQELFEKCQQLKLMQLEIEIAKAKARLRIFEEYDMEEERKDTVKCSAYADINSKDTGKRTTPLVTANDTPSLGSNTMHGETKVNSVLNKQEQNDAIAGNEAEESKQNIQRQTNINATTDSNSITAQLLDTQRRMMSSMLLPSPQVKVFDGDVIEYSTFVNAFDTRIALYAESNSDKLYYLDQYSTGEPKDLIGGCMFINPEEGYTAARKLLDEEYGNSYKISVAFMNKLLSWPKIVEGDARGLKQFSFYLTKCLHAMYSISDMTVLNHNLQRIIAKLPYGLQDRWMDQLQDLTQCGNVSYKDVVSFVSLASKAINHPVFGKEAIDGMRPSSPPQQTIGNFSTCILTLQPCCVVCHSHHDLDECEDFAALNTEGKRNIIRENGLCFGCYGNNHVSRNCVKKRKCKICGKCHPTALHDNKFKLNS